MTADDLEQVRGLGYLDDVALCWTDHHTRYHLLVLEPADVCTDQLDRGSVERDVECAGVRNVRQEEPHHFTLCDLASVLGLAVDEEDVAEASHQ